MGWSLLVVVGRGLLWLVLAGCGGCGKACLMRNQRHAERLCLQRFLHGISQEAEYLAPVPPWHVLQPLDVRELAHRAHVNLGDYQLVLRIFFRVATVSQLLPFTSGQLRHGGNSGRRCEA